MAQKLTKNLIETTLKRLPEGEATTVYDSEVDGLHIEIKATRRVVWKVRVLKGEARNRKTRLGQFPEMSVDDARKAATEWLGQFDSSMKRSDADKLKDFLGLDFQDVINAHIQDLVIEHQIDTSDPVGKWRPQTVVQKRNTLTKLCRELRDILMISEDKPLKMSLITLPLLKEWHAARGYGEEGEAPYVGNRTIDYLKALLRPHYEDGRFPYLPKLEKHQEFERDMSLGRDDLFALLDALEKVSDAVAASALRVIAFTGQRPDEIRRLMRSDDQLANYVDMKKQELVFRDYKTARSATTKAVRVALPQRAFDVIAAQPTMLPEAHAAHVHNVYVFGDADTFEPVSYDRLLKALDEAKKSVIDGDLVQDVETVRDMTPYTLRHTFATLAAIAGWSVADIANQLKHKNLRTTLKYIKRAEQYHARLRAKSDLLFER